MLFSEETPENQAFNALVFLYKHVLLVDLGEFGHMKRAKGPGRVFTEWPKQRVVQVSFITLQDTRFVSPEFTDKYPYSFSLILGQLFYDPLGH